MANERTQTDEIQREMAAVRSRLHYEMRGVVQDVNRATDWRMYVRSRPWMAIGVAFASGYLLVPRRTRSATADSRSPELHVPQQAVFAENKTKEGVSAPRWVLGALAPVALRAAQSYALNYVEGLITSSTQGTASNSNRRSDEPRAAGYPNEPDLAARR